MKITQTWTGFYKYLRKQKKMNLFASALMMGSGIISASFGVTHIIKGLDLWLSSGALWGPSFNIMMADSLMGMLLVMPSLAMLLTGYLLSKGHSKGIVLSSIFASTLFVLTITGFISFNYGMVMAVLCILAALIGLMTRLKSPNERLDSPIVTENLMKFGLRFSGIICIAILAFLIAYIGIRGAKYVTWDFLTSKWISWRHAGNVVSGVVNAPLGGLFDFIVGSFLLCSLCEVIAIPLGLGAAIFLAEYAKENAVTRTIRFFVETLAGIPSIVIGLIGFAFFCTRLNMGRSLLAGAISLAFMILPWNIRVAEESIKAVPFSYREASYALGATKWQTIRHVILPSAMPGILTGILLGLGGAIGETAVVMLTAGDIGVTQMPNNLTLTGAPIPTLPVWIYGAYQLLFSFQGEAGQGVWEGQNASLGGAFVLLVIFLAISIVALIIRNHFLKKLSTM